LTADSEAGKISGWRGRERSEQEMKEALLLLLIFCGSG
jgi:hypothetical protein